MIARFHILPQQSGESRTSSTGSHGKLQLSPPDAGRHKKITILRVGGIIDQRTSFSRLTAGHTIGLRIVRSRKNQRKSTSLPDKILLRRLMPHQTSDNGKLLYFRQDFGGNNRNGCPLLQQTAQLPQGNSAAACDCCAAPFHAHTDRIHILSCFLSTITKTNVIQFFIILQKATKKKTMMHYHSLFNPLT